MPEEKDSTAGLFFKLWIVPSLIVLASVLVFALFGRLAYEQKSAADYLSELERSRGERTWQAALGLASVLASEPDQVDRPALAQKLVQMLARHDRYDDQVRSYLVLALGHLRQPEALEPLIELARRGDSATLRIHAIWALAQLGDARARDAVRDTLRDEDDGVRKIAAYAAGELGGGPEEPDPALRAALRKLLQDPKEDVAWNAALSLAKLGDSGGVAWLEKLLDRSYLDSVATLGSKDKESILVSALHAAAILKPQPLRGRVESLKVSDPSLKVRQAALEAQW